MASEPEEDRPPPVPIRSLRLVLALIIFSQVVFNFDNGAISASLETIGKSMDMDFFEEGILSSLVYLGLVISCIFAGKVLQKFNPKWVIVVSLIANTFCYLLFSVSTSIKVLLVSRFGVGMFRTFLVLHTPIWVDEFAPMESKTTWMSLQQAGVPLGIMAGYLVSGLVEARTLLEWRFCFYIQSFFCIPVIVLFLLIPSSYLSHENNNQQMSGLWTHFSSLWSNPLYMASVFSISALYFVVTGIQVWSTQYMTGPPINAELSNVVLAFSATAATAPIMGVLAGGKVVDWAGGYRGTERAIVIAMYFGLAAQITALGAIITSDFVLFISLIWIVLFCGGAIVPAGTGILLSSVSKESRPYALCFGMLCNNLFGYFAGPFVSGLVSNYTGNIAWGFRVSMVWGWLSLFSMVTAYNYARKNHTFTKLAENAMIRKGASMDSMEVI